MKLHLKPLACSHSELIYSLVFRGRWSLTFNRLHRASWSIHRKLGKLEDAADVFTPFALSAHAEGLSYRGGKLDDVAAGVGLLCRSHGEPVSESLLGT